MILMMSSALSTVILIFGDFSKGLPDWPPWIWRHRSTRGFPTKTKKSSQRNSPIRKLRAPFSLSDDHDWLMILMTSSLALSEIPNNFTWLPWMTSSLPIDQGYCHRKIFISPKFTNQKTAGIFSKSLLVYDGQILPFGMDSVIQRIVWCQLGSSSPVQFCAVSVLSTSLHTHCIIITLGNRPFYRPKEPCSLRCILRWRLSLRLGKHPVFFVS